MRAGLEQHPHLFLPMTPTYRLSCHRHIKLGVIILEGTISALSCLHPPFLVDPFKFLLPYLLKEGIDLSDIVMAHGSLRCFKISGDRQSAIFIRLFHGAGVVGGWWALRTRPKSVSLITFNRL